ncbi:hypothetical protein LT493_12555 [Streptomyces tricolor]|nr:hypothetical protein [Streptomyces tricolor]
MVGAAPAGDDRHPGRRRRAPPCPPAPPRLHRHQPGRPNALGTLVAVAVLAVGLTGIAAGRRLWTVSAVLTAAALLRRRRPLLRPPPAHRGRGRPRHALATAPASGRAAYIDGSTP